MVKMKSRTELKKNVRYVGFFFLVVFCVIALRAYFLQVLKSEELTEMIQNQCQTSITLSPHRGTIYDRNGMELAVSLDVESLYARPHMLADARSAARSLSPILGISPNELSGMLTSKKPFVWIQRKLSPAQAEQIKLLQFEGLGFLKESQRFYPNKELAGQVLGFTGVDTQGLEGIEREYDAILKGKPRKLYVDRDALGRHVFIEGVQPSEQTQGNDLMLTIDKNIQYIAEKELQAAVSLSQAKGGVAVVMDPATGEVLASAVAPLFNPNQYADASADSWRNRAVTDVFEPGSTFKTFLVSSAIEERVVKPTDQFFCENGVYHIAQRVIHDVHSYGWLDVINIVKHSSNIGASKIGRQLGREQLYKYIKRFGFAGETGVKFPSEAAGFLPPINRCSDHMQSTLSFGHSISVTPLQMTTAYAAIANGGMLMRPTLVKKVVDVTGMTVQETTALARWRVISEDTCDTMRDILQQVVLPGGTGTKAAVAGFTVAGKTGTSQKLDKEGGYSSSRVIASFAGFVPADNPRLTIMVIIDEPQKMKYGGEIAAPAFSRIAHGVLNYLHVAPENTQQNVPGMPTVPNVPNAPKQWQETKTTPTRAAKLG